MIVAIVGSGEWETVVGRLARTVLVVGRSVWATVV